MLAKSIPHNHDDDDTVERIAAAGPKASHFECVKVFSERELSEHEYVLIVSGC